jgi:hypothetical protein
MKGRCSFYEIRAPDNFGALVTIEEWTENRRSRRKALIYFLLFWKPTAVAVAIFSMMIGGGLLSCVFCFWGWLILGSACLPHANKRNSIAAIITGSTMTAAGFLLVLLDPGLLR